jgi:glycosyltransferase involved in cell wall biosynthesis
MTPLRIAFLSRWYWEENRRWASVEGGPTQQLAEAVAALGHEVIVLSQSPKVEELQRSQIGTLEVWLSPREKRRDFLTAVRDKWAKHTYSHRKVFSDAQALAEFFEQRGPFDVLWAHTEEPDGLVAAVAAREGLTLPPLVTQIQALRYRFDNGVPVFNQEPALRLAFRQADRILANSELVADSLSAYAGGTLTTAKLREKTRVVFPNLQREFIRAADGGGSGPAAESNRILYFGALNEGKGGHVFMDSILQTKAAATGATFAVAGDFSSKDPRFLQRWKAALAPVQGELAPGQLELLGEIPLLEVIRQIRRASLVVFPSLFDAFSRALVEALILGRPVVTTRKVGAWPLVTEHVCGMVVAPNNSTALANAIDAVLHPEAHYASNASHLGHRLIHEVSPEAIALQVVQNLEEVAKR